MDFITGLPKSRGFGANLVIVDRFTKFLLFIACIKIAMQDNWLNHTSKSFFLFGTPEEIISDRGSVIYHNSGENLILFIN